MKKIFITVLLSVLIFETFGQSCTDVEEWLRKRHTISNMTYGHPYTTFDRHNGLSLMDNIINIRKRIIQENVVNKEGPVFLAYQAIYANAKSPMPSDNGMSNAGVSELALWAKNNAFVFLVGMNANGELIYKQFKSTTIYKNNKTT
jgi:hypothetical protein